MFDSRNNVSCNFVFCFRVMQTINRGCAKPFCFVFLVLCFLTFVRAGLYSNSQQSNDTIPTCKKDPLDDASIKSFIMKNKRSIIITRVEKACIFKIHELLKIHDVHQLIHQQGNRSRYD